MDIDQLAEISAVAIRTAFDNFHIDFNTITRRARRRFEQCDWAGAQCDAKERLDLYKKIVDNLIAETRATLNEQGQNRNIWMRIKKRYSDLITSRDDFELAETFFNSVTRKIFATVGVDRDIEFVDSDFEPPPLDPAPPIYRAYWRASNTRDLVRDLLADYRFEIDYQDVEFDVTLISERLDSELAAASFTDFDAIETLESIFYRNKGAYIVGRVRRGERIIPFVLPLLNGEQGVYVDALVLNQDEVSIIFSFTRSYFHVEAARPYELISFLKSIMPLKPIAELYISIGYNKHGKTVLYRDLLRYLKRSPDRFETARGKKGMVMIVFTLATYDVVFKVIKDRPAYPKTSNRADVIDKYNLVFNHDRAGRLVDAQEYEHLQFDIDRFAPDLLAELLADAASSVVIEDTKVTIRHLYTERKLVPLNLYVKEVATAPAQEAVLDYGNAIKDIVAANLFPGDILLKNFGVTRHGRVVFYDYDEICQLTECHFRALPPARHFDDEFAAEPWFYVNENDIFPEEFKSFLELEGELRDTFLAAHDDLFHAKFWLNMQTRLRDGEFADIFPYRQASRLRCQLPVQERV